jgi:hypothetical protein
MKEEFHEFRKRQAKRRRSEELESACWVPSFCLFEPVWADHTCSFFSFLKMLQFLKLHMNATLHSERNNRRKLILTSDHFQLFWLT